MRTLMLFLTLTSVISFFSCSESYAPKPRGYFRIDFPERSYNTYKSDCPFVFDYPSFAVINKERPGSEDNCWMDIDFPGYRGRLHISYKQIENNLVSYIEDSRKLAYKHTIKADAINEHIFIDDNSLVYGVLYDIKGDTASALQFFLTDSSYHFFRGALYFSVEPNKDSLAPVIDYFREDIRNIIETFAWK